MPMLRKFESPIIAIVGNLESPIAKAADVVLDARVDAEADPLNLMPTSSSTVCLALGDALAASLVKARDFTPEDFATFHPEDSLGAICFLPWARSCTLPIRWQLPALMKHCVTW